MKSNERKKINRMKGKERKGKEKKKKSIMRLEERQEQNSFSQWWIKEMKSSIMVGNLWRLSRKAFTQPQGSGLVNFEPGNSNKCMDWQQQLFYHPALFRMEAGQLKKKYDFNQNQPLARPHSEKGVFNAYYKGFDIEAGTDVLISKFQQPLYERLLAKQKGLVKLKEIRHKNLAQIFDVILLGKGSKTMYVILEWCEGDSLYEYQKSQKSMDFEIGTKILRDVTQGLQAIHELSNLHRHINMVNVEFSKEGQAKLTFKCLYAKTIYLSPDEKQGTRSQENQIFSLGVLIYKLLFNSIPFDVRSLEEEKVLVEKGPKFDRNSKGMLPIAVPAVLKTIVSRMLSHDSGNRPKCREILDALKEDAKHPSFIPKQIEKKILKSSLIPLLVRSSEPDYSVMIVLEPLKKELKEIHIFTGRKAEVEKYINETLKAHVEAHESEGLMPVEKYRILDDQYLVIQSFYQNQGNLAFYTHNSGRIDEKRMDEFMEKLIKKIKGLRKPYKYLTTDHVALRKGDSYIHFPPFNSQGYMERIKDQRMKMMMIAPEVQAGEGGDNADGWSVSMMKYLLVYGEEPELDANGNAIISREAISLEDRQFYSAYLVSDPKRRAELKSLKVLEFDDQRQVPATITSSNQLVRNNPMKEQLNINNSSMTNEYVESSGRKIEGQSRKSKETPHIFCKKLAEKSAIFYGLEKHWTKTLRVGLKMLLGLLLLIFLFYWNFYLINGQLMAEHSIYEAKTITIRAFEQDSTPDTAYTLVTKTPSETQNQFYNSTLDVLRNEYRCVLDDYGVGSDVVGVINRTGFTTYQTFGIILCVLNLLVFCISLAKMDYPKIIFISQFSENNFTVLWNWMFINMALATQISFSYLLYGSLFHMKLSPCLEKATLVAVQLLLKDQVTSFNVRFIWIYIGWIFSYFIIIFLVINPQFSMHRFLKLGIVVLYFAGVFSRIMGGSGDHIAFEKESVFGKVGELLLLIICLIFLIIDLIFGCRIFGNLKERKIVRVEDHSIDDLHENDN